jgi:predicted hotdog family 3-hydroxylacyl-ACP dehydratase
MPTFPPVEELLPHKPPMVLLDALEEIDEHRCLCRVDVRPACPFFEEGGVPAFVGVEYLAQAVGVLSGWKGSLSGEPPRVGFLLSVREYRCELAIFPEGEALLVEVVHAWGDGDMLRFDGSIRRAGDGLLLAKGSLNVYGPKDPGAVLENA